MSYVHEDCGGEVKYIDNDLKCTNCGYNFHTGNYEPMDQGDEP